MNFAPAVKDSVGFCSWQRSGKDHVGKEASSLLSQSSAFNVYGLEVNVYAVERR